ncbi:GH116 family glycosyl-hydrolase [Fulvivirgaceae bacterium BMA10]|uniref:GH116 family glycosyl-hydrolase n=1 Tax=Splendidivirga corallicola TaxID=3051826 RepID=A0ABT8KKU3_9BACT|nr:GH116 family glycosyl-hydrolase [Fulvivirgaceae bacterium BMA10]
MKQTGILLTLLLFNITYLNAQVARELESKASIDQNDILDQEEQLRDYYKLSTDPELFQLLGETVYRDQNLEAIQFPVGGIGTGCIQYDGNATPRFWQIFNNMTHDFIPNSFFAIRVNGSQGAMVRALQTQDVGPFRKMESLEARAKFPFLQYDFLDNMPIRVSMKVFNPFIPTNLKDSGIPAVFYQFTLENVSNEAVEVNLLASQQNAVGFSQIPKILEGNSFAENYELSLSRTPVKGNYSQYYGGNTNMIKTSKETKSLIMQAGYDRQHEHFGQMMLMITGEEQTVGNARGVASWELSKEAYQNFVEHGELIGERKAKKSRSGTTWTGALNVPVKLEAGEKREVNMVLAWYFPNGRNGGHMDKWDGWGNGDWEGDGNHYATQWKDILDLEDYLTKNHKRLVSETEIFTETFFDTNLPFWLKERISNQLAILKSRTIFFDKKGYVGLWEGAGAGDGSCAGNCNHVWHYPQAHARLFPEIGRRIKEQSFKAIKSDGQIPYRQPAGGFAFDGQCGDIIGAFREYLISTDAAWLKNQYPAIKNAMNYLVEQHDHDQDGWLSDLPKHTTYDASMTGNPSFLSSLYLAALRASQQMALVCGDESQANEWRDIADNSARLQNEKLWNGEYFIQVRGEKNATDYENGCHSDQLLGQWWADQIGLGSMYPDYKIKSATNAILKYNFKSNLKKHNQGHRTFALPDEAGVVVTTWPDNDQTSYASGYSGEVWSTFEYTIASSLFKHDQIRDALTLLHAGYHRYDGRLRTGYIGDWGNFGFSGNPFGDDECGQFYSRALSIWSVLLAAQGFEYNGPERSIGFNPKWKPDNHTSFFSTANGWGLFSQKRDTVAQSNKLTVKYGTLDLSKITLYLGQQKISNVIFQINGKEKAYEVRRNGNYCEILWEGSHLKKGDEITITIKA